MLKRKLKITFVCHGSTIYTTENRLYDQSQYPPLDANGIVEVEKISEWLKKRSPRNDKIYTAPTLRAINSAKIIAKEYNQDFEIIENLISKNEGFWSGLSFEEIEEKYLTYLQKYHNFTATFKDTGCESILEYNERSQKLIKQILDANIDKRVILICDATFIRSMIAYALNIPADKQSRIYIPTASATQINFYKEFSTLMYSGYLPL